MCELKVYMKGEKESLMEGVVLLVTRGEMVQMEDILGRTKEARGRIVEVSISGQRAVLEPAWASSVPFGSSFWVDPAILIPRRGRRPEKLKTLETRSDLRVDYGVLEKPSTVEVVLLYLLCRIGDRRFLRRR